MEEQILTRHTHLCLSLYFIYIKICVCVSHRTGVLSFINIVPAIGLRSLWNGPEQIWASVNAT